MNRLDLRGKVCPHPTTETLDALKRLPEGERLDVVSDYLPARYTIPRLVDDLGYSHETHEEGGGDFTISIVKAAAPDSD